MMNGRAVGFGGRRSRLRSVALLWFIVHLLFTQLALAAYLCPASPGTKTDQGAVTHSLAVASLSPGPCEGVMSGAVMDPDQPNLCRAHCDADGQASGSTHPLLQPGLDSNLTVSLLISNADRSEHHARRTAITAPSRAPPHTIEHCCWRI